MEPQKPEPPTSPSGRTFTFERWVTSFVFVGAALVYLSLWLQSLPVFVIGELICLCLAPIIAWFEREEILRWWRQRGRCPACGYDLRGIKGPCPSCGYRRFGE
jgi:hypothetical protein